MTLNTKYETIESPNFLYRQKNVLKEKSILSWSQHKPKVKNEWQA